MSTTSLLSLSACEDENSYSAPLSRFEVEDLTVTSGDESVTMQWKKQADKPDPESYLITWVSSSADEGAPFGTHPAKAHRKYRWAKDRHAYGPSSKRSMLQSPNIADVFDVDNKMNREIIFAVRYNKTVVGEGHGAWYSLTNLTDENNRTNTLNHLYDGTNDAREELLEYRKYRWAKDRHAYGPSSKRSMLQSPESRNMQLH